MTSNHRQRKKMIKQPKISEIQNDINISETMNENNMFNELPDTPIRPYYQIQQGFTFLNNCDFA